eukprot:TRINITY_DN2870_c0_g1_i4.p1 TRINITY_DN2870_c0_g1~~TRINITY_DN2870_c0_g1_i4.p1  ORF type:complete len:202 (-),score=27.89 TRINITY_DN2870_c0_g1_i4:263-868(-)
MSIAPSPDNFARFEDTSDTIETQAPPPGDLLRSDDTRPMFHPFASFFHICFKVSAWIAYLILFYVWEEFVSVFIIVVTLLALDFWTVKNITGRKMVALRWWNQIKSDGSSHWRFENGTARRAIHPKEKAYFWFWLYLAPVSWILLALTAIFGFKWRWLLIVVVGVGLGVANVVGYLKCSREARAAATDFVSQYKGAIGQVT